MKKISSIRGTHTAIIIQGIYRFGGKRTCINSNDICTFDTYITMKLFFIRLVISEVDTMGMVTPRCSKNLSSRHLGPEQRTANSTAHPRRKVSLLAPSTSIGRIFPWQSSMIHRSKLYGLQDPHCSSFWTLHRSKCLLVAKIQKCVLIVKLSSFEI